MLFGLDLGLGHFFGSFMTWGFLIAFLFNVFGKVVGFKDSYSIIVSALVVFMSYFFSDQVFEFDTTTRVYLQWMYQDILTIFAILTLHLTFKIKHHRATFYIYTGLLISGLLFFSMWIDIQVLANQDPWFLWSLYSIGVNTVDYVMIIALIVGKDWLGLVRLGRFIKSKLLVKKQALSEKKKCVDSEIKQKRLAHNMIEA